MENVTMDFLQNQINMLQNNLKSHQNCDYWKNENGRIQSQIIDLIDSFYENGDDAEYIVVQLSNIIDYLPTKEISFTATMNFTGTISIPANEAEDFDLEDILGEAYVDIKHGDVVIDNYELYDANEC